MSSVDQIADWLRTMLDVQRFEGHTAFLFDGRIRLSIDLVDGDEALLFQAQVGAVPGSAREAFYEGLLTMSHPCNGLRGCGLSIDAARDNVVLWYQYPVSALDIERFQDILTGFVGQADALAEQLGSGAGADRQLSGDARGARPSEDRLDPRRIRP